jgi:hypothetical protein
MGAGASNMGITSLAPQMFAGVGSQSRGGKGGGGKGGRGGKGGIASVPQQQQQFSPAQQPVNAQPMQMDSYSPNMTAMNNALGQQAPMRDFGVMSTNPLSMQYRQNAQPAQQIIPPQMQMQMQQQMPMQRNSFGVFNPQMQYQQPMYQQPMYQQPQMQYQQPMYPQMYGGKGGGGLYGLSSYFSPPPQQFSPRYNPYQMQMPFWMQ